MHVHVVWLVRGAPTGGARDGMQDVGRRTGRVEAREGGDARTHQR